jgi:CelD/BcsL family acetyltransferase involved in cellulose biosynthesis
MKTTEINVDAPGQPLVRTEQSLTMRLLLGELSLYRRAFDAVVLRSEPGARPDIDALSRSNLQRTRHEVVFFPSVHPSVSIRTLRYAVSGLCYSSRPYPLYYVDLTPSFEQFVKKFSSSSRKNLRRDLTKFQELSGRKNCVREYRNPEDMDEFHRTARIISAVTFQERLLGVGLPDTPEFVEQLIRDARNDLVRGYVLFDKERPVAFAYCGGRGTHLIYRTIGYDPAYREHSPGRTLLYVILERLFAERRFDLLDFGPGEAFYKSFFSTHSLTCADVYCFRYSIPNVLFVVAHFGLSIVSRTLVGITKKFGVKEKLKKWARANLRR